MPGSGKSGLSLQRDPAVTGPHCALHHVHCPPLTHPKEFASFHHFNSDFPALVKRKTSLVLVEISRHPTV